MDKLKTILSKIKVPKIKAPKINVPKISKPNLNPLLDKVGLILSKIWLAIKKVPTLSVKAIKGFIVWLGKAIKESIAQVWTLLGFFIAWLTLTGTAQQIVGIATVFSTILWLVTIPLREEKEE